MSAKSNNTQSTSRQHRSAFDFIEALYVCRSVEDTTKQFRSFIERFGFEHFGVGDLVNPHSDGGQTLFHTQWPSGWEERWVSQDYMFCDPVVAHILQSTRPIIWSSIKYKSRSMAQKVMSEASEFGMLDGFSVGVRCSTGLTVCVSVAGHHVELTKIDAANLEMACVHFEDTIENFICKERKPRTQQLSQREREVLSWISAGKTDWEISSILSISQSTSQEHAKRAIRKLGAVTRAQAVAIGIRSGQILP